VSPKTPERLTAAQLETVALHEARNALRGAEECRCQLCKRAERELAEDLAARKS